MPLLCHAVQLFCTSVMVANQPPQPRRPPYDSTLSGSDGPDCAAKFLVWYILEGHAGLNVSNQVLLYCSSYHQAAGALCMDSADSPHLIPGCNCAMCG